MKTNITEAVFILDKSGSMSGLENDTIGGFNAMLKKQKELPGQCRLTTVLFDDKYQLLHDRLDLMAVNELTPKDYYVEGWTALLDAMGKSILKVDSVMQSTAMDYRPDKVLFVIITDGMENSSSRFTREQISQMVTQRREMGWEFIFLGANMDAIAVAKEYGIPQDRARSYAYSPTGVRKNYASASDVMCSIRSRGVVDEDWDKHIVKDDQKGKKNS